MITIQAHGYHCWGCDEEVDNLERCEECDQLRCDDCIAEHDEMGCDDNSEDDYR